MPSLFERGKVRRVIGALIRNRPQRIPRRDYLNLGCGGNVRPEFVNLDYGWRPGVICWDILKGLPFESQSFKGITTEHTLEHFTWREALDVFLPECFRVLAPGGTLRIVVPCAEKAVNAYVLSREEGETAIPFREARNGDDRIPMTAMLHLNNTFRRIYEDPRIAHKFVYDYQTLDYFLHLSSFVDIRQESFMHGHDPTLLIDTERRAKESLYVEASKH